MDLLFVAQSALVLVIVFFTCRKLEQWKHVEHERQLGRGFPNKYPHYLPWGIDIIMERMAALKAGRFNRLNYEQFVRCGRTFEERSLGVKIINTMDPENMKTVASIHFDDYSKQDARTKAMLPFLGHGIFSKDGKAWKQSRDLIKPLFARAELSDADRFRGHVDQMMGLIPTDGTTVDMQPLLERLFVDCATEFIFGSSINSLDESNTESDDFLHAFNKSLLGTNKRGGLVNGRLGFLYVFDKSWKQSCDKVHSFIDRQILQALRKPNLKSSTDNSAKSHYNLVHAMAQQIPHRVALRSELLNVFLPARESNAVALTNTMFNLARNPAVWKQLRQQALAIGDQPLTFERLKSLDLFRYTLLESIRLHGPAGRFQRIAIRDTVLPRGGGPDGSYPISVPKGTVVAVNTFAMLHDPQVWGDDVEVFRPARFEGRRFSWDFAPFFRGPRVCPAQQQFLTQGVYLLVRLVIEFETIENRDPCIEYVEQMKILGHSRNGAKIALHRQRSERSRCPKI